MLMASCIFFAIRDAVRAAREENGVHDIFSLDIPVTSQDIRLACQDHMTDKVKQQIYCN